MANEDKQYTIYKYPVKEDNIKDFGDNTNDDWIQFVCHQKGANGSRISGQQNVHLFIPAGSLSYSRNFDYSNESASSLANVVDSFLGGNSLGNKVTESIKGELAKISGLTDTGKAQTQAFQNLGYAFNPNMEVFFKTPAFREFSFTFPFLPKNKEESESVKKIIEHFMVNSHPQTNGTDNKYIYKFPNTWTIKHKNKYIFGGKNGQTKNCVLTSADVSYGAESGYTMFEDGSPVMSTLKLSFREMEIWIKGDDGYLQ